MISHLNGGNTSRTEFSEWALTDRHAVHAAHAERAKRFLTPSPMPYPQSKYTAHAPDDPSGHRADERRAVASWDATVPPLMRASIAERLRARREAVAHA